MKNPLVIVLSAVCLMLAVLVVSVWITGERNNRETVQQFTAVNDALVIDSMVSGAERTLQKKKFYAKIIATHGAANGNAKMGRSEMAQFINDAVKFEKLLSLPDFYFAAAAVMETSFDSGCVGGIGEIGVFQHHKTAIPIYRQNLVELYATCPAIAREIDPQLVRHEDCRNSLVSLRVQAVMAWGARREFADELYWVSAIHWGEGRVRPWYVAGVEPQGYYVFLTGQGKIDKRSPLMYYFHYKRISTNFQAYNVDIGKWSDEYRTYRDDCNKNEREYIDARNLISRLIKIGVELEQKRIELDENLEAVKSYREKLASVDADLGKIYGEAKRGKASYPSVFQRTKDKILAAFK